MFWLGFAAGVVVTVLASVVTLAFMSPNMGPRW